MENAAKALTIAGGILIAIIVISTLVYSFQQWGFFPKAKEEEKKIKELKEFNHSFEAYNKQNLYGTDVITVLNKAMANNDKYGITDPSDLYFVDVKFILNTSVDGYKIKTKVNKKNGTKTYSDKEKEYTNSVFDKNIVYKLSDRTTLNNIKNLCIDSPIKSKPIKNTREYIEYEQTYSSAAEFKMKYFTCAGIEYNEIGRVRLIKFVELEEKRDKVTNKLTELIKPNVTL